MPPVLALLICCLFVLLLLRYDYKIAGVQSWVVWVPTLWVIRCASVPFNTWFDMGTYRELGASVESGNPFDRNVLIVLILIGLATLVKRRVDLRSVVKDNKCLFILLIYMLVTILWSDYPFVSLRRWFKVSGDLVMAFVVLTEISPVKTVESILRRTVYVTVPLSLTLVKYYPVWGVNFGRYSGDVSWAGVAGGKNSLGILCVIAVMIWVKDWTNNVAPAERASNREKGALFGLLAVTLLLLRGPGGAYSATSLIILSLALPVFFLLRRFRSASQVLTACGIAVVIAIGAPVFTQVVLGTTLVEIVAPLVGRNSDLTGRADAIWAPLEAIAMKNPIVGVGFGGFWIHPMVLDKFSVNQAHNGYLDIFIELGAIGLLLFALVIIEFLIKGSKGFQYDAQWGAFLVTFLLMSVMHNYTESSYLKSTALLWTMFCMLTISAGSVRQRVSVTQQANVRDVPKPAVMESPLVRGTRTWSRPTFARRHHPLVRRGIARPGASRLPISKA